MRLFTAITLPSDAKKKLSVTSDKIKSHTSKGNFSRPDNYHITLVFLGDIAPTNIDIIKSIINEAAHSYPPMHLNCLDVGYFKKGNNKILYYNVGGNITTLSKLQSFMYSKFLEVNLCKEQGSYIPHMTLARNTRIDTMPMINQQVDFPAGEITLMHSTRVDDKLTYIPIYSCPFTGYLTIDRIEEEIAVCEAANRIKFNIEKKFMPKSVSSGSKIRYNGFSFELDTNETQKQAKNIREKFNKEIRKHK